MVSGKNLKPINIYSVVPTIEAQIRTPTKVINKLRKTRRRKYLYKIKIAQSETTASARFSSTALHSVSHAIICDHTEKIAFV